MHALQSIKEQLFAGILIESLLENESALDESQRGNLMDFFALSLKEHPQERAEDMQILLEMLRPSLLVPYLDISLMMELIACEEYRTGNVLS